MPERGWKRINDRGKRFSRANRDVEALVTAIMHLLKKPDLVERKAECRSEVAEEKFNVHRANAVILKSMGLIS